MAKFYKLSASVGYSPAVGLLVAVIYGVIAALTAVVANISTVSTVEIVILAVIAGLTVGLQHWQTPSGA